MEKKPLLDPRLTAASLILVALVLASCSLPRIMILRDPLTPEEHINLGVSYEKRGELDAALKEYRTAAKGNGLGYLYAGNIYFQQKEFGKAESAYRQAIKKTQSPEAYNNLAWLYYSQGTNLAEAEALATKAVELSPDSDTFKDTLERITKSQDSH